MNGEPSATDSAHGGVHAAPLTEQVYDTIHGWIIDGALAPGERLRVRDLAERVGTSVMPVREAIRRLGEAGLVVHEPYRGASVRGLDVTEMENIYAVRILLESQAARLGAEAADEATVRRMTMLWKRLDTAARDGDHVAALAADEELLDCLYARAGSEVLREVIRHLWHRCRSYRLLWARATVSTADGPRMWRFKPALLAAAVSRDGAAADEVIRESYDAARLALADMLKTP